MGAEICILLLKITKLLDFVTAAHTSKYNFLYECQTFNLSNQNNMKYSQIDIL